MSEFNIIEFENVIKASNRSDNDIDAKVKAYRQKLENAADELEKAKDTQLKKLNEFFAEINLISATGATVAEMREPDSVYVGKDYTNQDCIALQWEPSTCQMGPISGDEITVYYKAFAVPRTTLRDMLDGRLGAAGLITVEELDEY